MGAHGPSWLGHPPTPPPAPALCNLSSSSGWKALLLHHPPTTLPYPILRAGPDISQCQPSLPYWQRFPGVLSGSQLSRAPDSKRAEPSLLPAATIGFLRRWLATSPAPWAPGSAIRLPFGCHSPTTLYMTCSPSVQARAFPVPLVRSSVLPLCPRDTGRAQLPQPRYSVVMPKGMSEIFRFFCLLLTPTGSLKGGQEFGDSFQSAEHCGSARNDRSPLRLGLQPLQGSQHPPGRLDPRGPAVSLVRGVPWCGRGAAVHHRQ